ncbi:MAG: restriction endonuclease subunit S [Bacteroidia bacterium]
MEGIKVLHKKKVLTPKLRFKEFNDEWKREKIKKLLIDFRLGGNYPNEEIENDTPLIKMGNLGRGNIVLDKVLYISNGILLDEKDKIKYGDLFFNTRNTLDLVGKVAIWRNELPIAYYNSNLMCIKFENNFFMNFRFNSFEGVKGLRRLATGTTSVAAIYTKDLLKLKLTTPSFSEQQKIATFLTAVDEKIQQLNRKKQLLEQYKKGVMQQLFSGKLRFKDENGKPYPKWVEKKLGEVLDYIQPTKFLVESTEYDDSYETPVLTAGKTFILGYTNETKNIFSENLPVILFDDFTTATQFVDFPFKAKSSAMKILVAKGNESIGFIYEALRQIKYEIGGHGRHWISQFALMNIPYPCSAEQKKIADFLSGIDAKINLVAEELEATTKFKKGLLQQMFV